MLKEKGMIKACQGKNHQLGYHRKVSRKCTINLLILLHHLVAYLSISKGSLFVTKREQIMKDKRMTALH